MTRSTIPKTYIASPHIKKGLHRKGGGPHPRTEGELLSDAVDGLLKPELITSRCAEPHRRISLEEKLSEHIRPLPAVRTARRTISSKPWQEIEKALRVTDLLLQGGGFGAIVLDMGSIAPEFALRIPLSKWFRYQKAAERSQASILLLTQHSCAKSSAGIVLRLDAGTSLLDEATVFAGMDYHVELSRERSKTTFSNIVPMQKPSQRQSAARWTGRTAWTGSR